MSKKRQHGLRVEFNRYVREVYGESVWGEGDYNKTEIVAQEVKHLGLEYATYVEIACSLWHRWALGKGWKYPYWRLIASSKTIERVKVFLETTDSVAPVDHEWQEAFAAEVAFALDYIGWLIWDGDKPRRRKRGQLSSRLLVEVAEYVCAIYSVPFVTSDYNVIAQEIDNRE